MQPVVEPCDFGLALRREQGKEEPRVRYRSIRMKSAAELRADAAKCRRLASGLTDARTSASLLELALSYELEAEEKERALADRADAAEA